MKALTIEEAKTEKGYCVFRYDPAADKLVLDEAELAPGMIAPSIELTDAQKQELRESAEKLAEFRIFAQPVPRCAGSSIPGG